MTWRKAVARMSKSIHTQESREACDRKVEEVADELGTGVVKLTGLGDRKGSVRKLV